MTPLSIMNVTCRSQSSQSLYAGGMPTRVKCLHVLAGQSLAQGRGVNPLGDEVVDLLGAFWAAGPCVAPGADA